MSDDSQQEPSLRNTLFYQKRKHGKYREVTPPRLEACAADTHAHLQMLDNPALNLARCALHRVGFVCTIVDIFGDGSTTFDQLDAWRNEAEEIMGELVGPPDSLLGAATFADTEGKASFVPEVPPVYIATGCHPHNAKSYNDAVEANLYARLRDLRVVCIGEIGLDYHYDFSPRTDQREAFRRQIRVAHKAGLPVALHVREAHDEAFAILQEEGFPQAGTLLHCFNLDWEVLLPWIEQGCYVAFGGALTFNKNDFVRDAASRVPIDRLLTETDAPYMTPEPMRGMTCGPEHVIFTADKLAEVRGCISSVERCALFEQLLDNAKRLLRPRFEE